MLRLFLSLALCLAAAPLRADQAADYRAAFDGLGPAVLRHDPAAELDRTAAMIAGLQGAWFPALLLAGNGPDLSEPALIAQACTRQPRTITPVSTYSFDVALASKDATMTMHYTYAGYGLFHSLTTDTDLFDRFFQNRLDLTDPKIIAHTLRNSSGRGPVTILQPSPDILVFLAEGQGADIWGRCP
jgi:hypothetical protein